MAGACLFFGDGIITPAISVLSAVEGLKVDLPRAATTPWSRSRVVILLALFLVQYRGTGSDRRAISARSARCGSPRIGLLGLIEMVRHPAVLVALSPHLCHRISALHYRLAAFIAMGSVVLAVTGAEALYADMGHFGRGRSARLDVSSCCRRWR